MRLAVVYLMFVGLFGFIVSAIVYISDSSVYSGSIAEQSNYLIDGQYYWALAGEIVGTKNWLAAAVELSPNVVTTGTVLYASLLRFLLVDQLYLIFLSQWLILAVISISYFRRCPWRSGFLVASLVPIFPYLFYPTKEFLIYVSFLLIVFENRRLVLGLGLVLLGVARFEYLLIFVLSVALVRWPRLVLLVVVVTELVFGISSIYFSNIFEVFQTAHVVGKGASCNYFSINICFNDFNIYTFDFIRTVFFRILLAIGVPIDWVRDALLIPWVQEPLKIITRLSGLLSVVLIFPIIKAIFLIRETPWLKFKAIFVFGILVLLIYYSLLFFQGSRQPLMVISILCIVLAHPAHAQRSNKI